MCNFDYNVEGRGFCNTEGLYQLLPVWFEENGFFLSFFDLLFLFGWILTHYCYNLLIAERRLVEEVRSNDTLIIVGETGSGKTTRMFSLYASV